MAASAGNISGTYYYLPSLDKADATHCSRCMGFHSINDKRIPQRFICFTCALERDENWAIVRLQPWCTELFNKYAQLALFRSEESLLM